MSRKDKLRKLRMPGLVDEVAEDKNKTTIGKASEVVKRLKKKMDEDEDEATKEDKKFKRGQTSTIVTGRN